MPNFFCTDVSEKDFKLVSAVMPCIPIFVSDNIYLQKLTVYLKSGKKYLKTGIKGYNSNSK
jgi:hypothetical protein